MTKEITLGLVFGIFFGLLEGVIVSSFDQYSELYLLTGLLSLIAYVSLLIWFMISQSKKGAGYGKRFLAAFVFSMMIGLSYGIVAGSAHAIFAEQVAQSEVESIEMLREYGFEALDSDDVVVDPTGNFLYEFVAALLFNAFFGSIFSSLFALIKTKPKVQ